MGEPEAVCLRGEAQQPAIGVETIRAPGFDQFEDGFIAAIDQALA
jgi:hypothetical protein